MPVGPMQNNPGLEAIARAFGGLPRPEPLVRDPNHCCECGEHEAALQKVTPESIGLAEVGQPAWDPMCYVSDAAFQYFMPGLARLALGIGNAYYLDQFLFHLDSGRTETFTREQREAVAAFLSHVLKTRRGELQSDEAVLLRILDKLQGESEAD